MIPIEYSAIVLKYSHLGEPVCSRLTAIARTMAVMRGRLRIARKRAGANAELARCKAMWLELTGETV